MRKYLHQPSAMSSTKPITRGDISPATDDASAGAVAQSCTKDPDKGHAGGEPVLTDVRDAAVEEGLSSAEFKAELDRIYRKLDFRIIPGTVFRT